MQWLRVSSKDLRSWVWLSYRVGREEAKITSTSLPGLSQGQRRVQTGGKLVVGTIPLAAA